ncbi:hypothetical protein Dsin_010255 [Dipteronia sinensis]|uniref:RING-type domain-containing protein n=1 Tax=Dipteronia sinensis TaxID=43782 RepID=A0AAE0AT40_9ROSI|nr:hypothetical protein Dsin_010255 [Dipteronia sinensis]
MADNSTFLFLPIDPPYHVSLDENNTVYAFILAGILIISLVVPFLGWFFCCRSLNPETNSNSGDIEMVSVDPMVQDNIPSFRLESTSSLQYQEPKCMLCLNEFMLGESLVSLQPCGHTFHSTCNRSFISHADAVIRPCPLCRHPISN